MKKKNGSWVMNCSNTWQVGEKKKRERKARKTVDTRSWDDTLQTNSLYVTSKPRAGLTQPSICRADPSQLPDTTMLHLSRNLSLGTCQNPRDFETRHKLEGFLSTKIFLVEGRLGQTGSVSAAAWYYCPRSASGAWRVSAALLLPGERGAEQGRR